MKASSFCNASFSLSLPMSHACHTRSMYHVLMISHFLCPIITWPPWTLKILGPFNLQTSLFRLILASKHCSDIKSFALFVISQLACEFGLRLSIPLHTVYERKWPSHILRRQENIHREHVNDGNVWYLYELFFKLVLNSGASFSSCQSVSSGHTPRSSLCQFKVYMIREDVDVGSPVGGYL